MVPEGFGAGLELGGISFMVLKKSTSWAGTSANTLFASASRGAWRAKGGVKKSTKLWREKQIYNFVMMRYVITVTSNLIKWTEREWEIESHGDEDS